MMVPLRRALIVKEHGVLPYPEGTACADVLIAGERGGNMAKAVFLGLGVGALCKALSWIVQLIAHRRSATPWPTRRVLPNATLNVDISPEYMGVGYVIGPRIAGVMFAGGVLSWLVLLPLLTILGEYMTAPFPPVRPSGQDASSDDAAGADLARLHPLHRRRRRAGLGPHHPRPARCRRSSRRSATA